MDNFPSKVNIKGTYIANPKYFIKSKPPKDGGNKEKTTYDSEKLREVVTQEYIQTANLDQLMT